MAEVEGTLRLFAESNGFLCHRLSSRYEYAVPVVLTLDELILN